LHGVCESTGESKDEKASFCGEASQACACWDADLFVSAQEAAKHAITFDDMIRLHRISEAHVSPDGKWAAFTVSTPDMDANRGAEQHLVAPDHGRDAQCN